MEENHIKIGIRSVEEVGKGVMEEPMEMKKM